MILAGACFALVNTALQAATMLGGAASASVVFWQYLVALLVYLPWIARHRRAAVAARSIPWQVLRVGLAAIGVQLWTAGLAEVPIWQAIALIMLSPFFVTIGAGLVLREHVSPARWGAVVMGMVGGAIILEPWSDSFTLAGLLPVGAAAFWAASSLVMKHLTYRDSAETVTIWLLLLLTPINGALALGSGFTLPVGAIWYVLGAGLLTAAAQHVLVRAYSLADAAFLQPFEHVKLPFNVVLGFVAFGFAPEGAMWIGTAVILAASFYLLQDETRRPQAA
jgi:drug/metabolite transporter (DMT)-like permease